jgi:peptide/nickel transport system substrate-binding protein
MRYFRDVRGGNPEGMFYYDVTTGRTAFVDRLLWEGLTIVNQTGHVIPWLAESYSVSADQMQYNFTLRSGIRFHDFDTSGETLDGEDVKFSFDYAKTADSLWGQSLVYYIDNCTVDPADPMTVSFNMGEFDTWGIYTFSDLIILPEHVFSHVPYNHTSWHDLSNSTTKIGTGPYEWGQVESADPPTWWEFEAFADYWFNDFDMESSTGLDPALTYPRMEKFTIRVIEDSEATVTAIRSGDADLTRYTWADITSAAETYTSEIDIVQAKSIWRKILWLNNIVSPLSDKAVRKAIAYALDYASIVTTAENGYGFPVYNQYLPSEFFTGTGYHNSASDIYTFNKAQANKILDDAGYIDVDDDGVRDIPGWEPADDGDGAGYGILEALILFTGGLLILTIFQKKRR